MASSPETQHNQSRLAMNFIRTRLPALPNDCTMWTLLMVAIFSTLVANASMEPLMGDQSITSLMRVRLRRSAQSLTLGPVTELLPVGPIGGGVPNMTTKSHQQASFQVQNAHHRRQIMGQGSLSSILGEELQSQQQAAEATTLKPPLALAPNYGGASGSVHSLDQGFRHHSFGAGESHEWHSVTDSLSGHDRPFHQTSHMMLSSPWAAPTPGGAYIRDVNSGQDPQLAVLAPIGKHQQPQQLQFSATSSIGVAVVTAKPGSADDPWAALYSTSTQPQLPQNPQLFSMPSEANPKQQNQLPIIEMNKMPSLPSKASVREVTNVPESDWLGIKTYSYTLSTQQGAVQPLFKETTTKVTTTTPAPSPFGSGIKTTENINYDRQPKNEKSKGKSDKKAPSSAFLNSFGNVLTNVDTTPGMASRATTQTPQIASTSPMWPDKEEEAKEMRRKLKDKAKKAQRLKMLRNKYKKGDMQEDPKTSENASKNASATNVGSTRSKVAEVFKAVTSLSTVLTSKEQRPSSRTRGNPSTKHRALLKAWAPNEDVLKETRMPTVASSLPSKKNNIKHINTLNKTPITTREFRVNPLPKQNETVGKDKPRPVVSPIGARQVISSQSRPTQVQLPNRPSPTVGTNSKQYMSLNIPVRPVPNLPAYTRESTMPFFTATIGSTTKDGTEKPLLMSTRLTSIHTTKQALIARAQGRRFSSKKRVNGAKRLKAITRPFGDPVRPTTPKEPEKKTDGSAIYYVMQYPNTPGQLEFDPMRSALGQTAAPTVNPVTNYAGLEFTVVEKKAAEDDDSEDEQEDDDIGIMEGGTQMHSAAELNSNSGKEWVSMNARVSIVDPQPSTKNPVLVAAMIPFADKKQQEKPKPAIFAVGKAVLKDPKTSKQMTFQNAPGLKSWTKKLEGSMHTRMHGANDPADEENVVLSDHDVLDEYLDDNSDALENYKQETQRKGTKSTETPLTSVGGIPAKEIADSQKWRKKDFLKVEDDGGTSTLDPSWKQIKIIQAPGGSGQQNLKRTIEKRLKNPDVIIQDGKSVKRDSIPATDLLNFMIENSKEEERQGNSLRKLPVSTRSYMARANVNNKTKIQNSSKFSASQTRQPPDSPGILELLLKAEDNSSKSATTGRMEQNSPTPLALKSARRTPSHKLTPMVKPNLPITNYNGGKLNMPPTNRPIRQGTLVSDREADAPTSDMIEDTWTTPSSKVVTKKISHVASQDPLLQLMLEANDEPSAAKLPKESDVQGSNQLGLGRTSSLISSGKKVTEKPLERPIGATQEENIYFITAVTPSLLNKQKSDNPTSTKLLTQQHITSGRASVEVTARHKGTKPPGNEPKTKQKYFLEQEHRRSTIMTIWEPQVVSDYIVKRKQENVSPSQTPTEKNSRTSSNIPKLTLEAEPRSNLKSSSLTQSSMERKVPAKTPQFPKYSFSSNSGSPAAVNQDPALQLLDSTNAKTFGQPISEKGTARPFNRPKVLTSTIRHGTSAKALLTTSIPKRNFHDVSYATKRVITAKPSSGSPRTTKSPIIPGLLHSTIRSRSSILQPSTSQRKMSSPRTNYSTTQQSQWTSNKGIQKPIAQGTKIPSQPSTHNNNPQQRRQGSALPFQMTARTRNKDSDSLDKIISDLDLELFGMIPSSKLGTAKPTTTSQGPLDKLLAEFDSLLNDSYTTPKPSTKNIASTSRPIITSKQIVSYPISTTTKKLILKHSAPPSPLLPSSTTSTRSLPASTAVDHLQRLLSDMDSELKDRMPSSTKVQPTVSSPATPQPIIASSTDSNKLSSVQTKMNFSNLQKINIAKEQEQVGYGLQPTTLSLPKLIARINSEVKKASPDFETELELTAGINSGKPRTPASITALADGDLFDLDPKHFAKSLGLPKNKQSSVSGKKKWSRAQLDKDRSSEYFSKSAITKTGANKDLMSLDFGNVLDTWPDEGMEILQTSNLEGAAIRNRVKGKFSVKGRGKANLHSGIGIRTRKPTRLHYEDSLVRRRAPEEDDESRVDRLERIMASGEDFGSEFDMRPRRLAHHKRNKLGGAELRENWRNARVKKKEKFQINERQLAKWLVRTLEDSMHRSRA